MRRRTLLAGIGAGSASFAGCLSTAAGAWSDVPSGSDDRGYDECSREVIPYDQFPAGLRAEIDAALDDRYEADRVSLREAMDFDESHVSVDDDYYDPVLTVEEDSEVLELRPVEPRALPTGRPVRVEYDRDGERTVTVEVVAEDGSVLLDETRDHRPGAGAGFGRVARVGTHELRVTVADGDEVVTTATESIPISESYFDVIVVIEDEVDVTRVVADLPVCRFDG